MGGSNSSTRKITIVNDEQSGVIKVSNAVVRRLKGESDIQNAAATSKVSKPTSSQKPVESSVNTSDDEKFFSSSNKEFFSKQQSSGLPYEELYQQAMHLRKERDEQIRKVESRWRERVEAAEKQNTLVELALKDQYETTIKEIQSILPKKPCGSACKDLENQVYECYKSNLTTSLNCSKEVRDFRHCVQDARLRAFNRG